MKPFIIAIKIGAAILLTCAVFVMLVRIPNPIPYFIVSDESNLASAVNDFTAPVISLFSAVLLYLALTKQIEANKSAAVKKDVDQIFSLFSQIDSQISSFFYKYKRGSEPIRFSGDEAMFEFIKDYCFKMPNLPTIEKTFQDFLPGRLFVFLCRSFDHLKSHIDSADLAPKDKALFIQRWHAYYDAYLKNRLAFLEQRWADVPAQHDSTTNELVSYRRKWA